ncbi:putative sodium-coupled monocarboxylate transporter 2-like [Apostichopus japonicus]|uniref:Putative sodium-coupled monocarboxylate transporter 2-like n=1 Tax=Stichopus japonicus TaxID=307972 RepID=A0A2G8L477_STIJA|nr:putative sodium-coupled monocarboxylate transporter 2-like [Apostichopus japonicus]
MLAGLLAVLNEGSMRLGGLTEAWRIADERDRIDFWNFNPNPTIRHTFWSLAIGGAFQWTATYGTNQTQIQRYLSCGKKSTALWSLGLAICGMVVMLSIVCLVGIVMFAFYADCDPYTMGYLLPYFIMELFGDRPGLPGLCTACIFSAALSTVSSGINALTTITGEDIIKSIWPNIPESTYTIIIKVTACCFGIIAMLLSYLASQSDAILQATISVFGLVGGPLLGLFSLGVFFPCVNSYGAAFGPLISLGFSFWVGVGAIIYPPDSNSPSLSTELCVEGNTTQYISTLAPSIVDDPYPKIASFYGLSYMWYGGFSWCICIIFGLLVSFATRHNDPKETDVTLHRPIVDAFLCCFLLSVLMCVDVVSENPRESERKINSKNILEMEHTMLL